MATAKRTRVPMTGEMIEQIKVFYAKNPDVPTTSVAKIMGISAVSVGRVIKGAYKWSEREGRYVNTDSPSAKRLYPELFDKKTGDPDIPRPDNKGPDPLFDFPITDLRERLTMLTAAVNSMTRSILAIDANVQAVLDHLTQPSPDVKIPGPEQATEIGLDTGESGD